MTVARHQEPETHRLAGFGLEPEPTVELTQEFGFDGYRSPTDEIQSPCSRALAGLKEHLATSPSLGPRPDTPRPSAHSAADEGGGLQRQVSGPRGMVSSPAADWLDGHQSAARARPLQPLDLASDKPPADLSTAFQLYPDAPVACPPTPCSVTATVHPPCL